MQPSIKSKRLRLATSSALLSSSNKKPTRARSDCAADFIAFHDDMESQTMLDSNERSDSKNVRKEDCQNLTQYIQTKLTESESNNEEKNEKTGKNVDGDSNDCNDDSRKNDAYLLADEFFIDEDSGDDSSVDDEAKTRIFSDPNGFQIWDHILGGIQSAETTTLPSDNDSLLISNPFITVGDAARDFLDMIQFHDVSPSLERHLMSLLRKHAPAFQLPIGQTKGGNYKSILHRYDINAFKFLIFDMCASGCTAFVGDQKDLKECPFCRAQRFLPCTHYRCKYKKNWIEDNCVHSRRVPVKRVYYRPLMPLILYLLDQPGFLLAIAYKNHKQGHNDTYADIRDGSVYKSNMQAMIDKFNVNNFDEDVIPINLLLSEFYDGIQLYKWAMKTFWPLFISILNLPPNYRNKVGVGTFLLSTFTGVIDSTAEEFLFKSCFVGELKKFEQGILVEHRGKKYYIQVRLILHILDAKAVEKVMKVQGTNSYEGCCFCNTGKGMRRKDSIKGMHYPGHRSLLPINNVLRSLGQSRQCCPAEYYAREDIDNIESRKNNFQAVQQRTNVVQTARWSSLVPCITTAEHTNALRALIRQKDFSFFHAHLNRFADMQESLWYHHCDYRQQVAYKRKTNEEYFADYKEFIANGSIEAVGGVKGMWYFYSLSYSDYAHNGFDPGHGVADSSRNLTDILKNERPTAEINKGVTEFHKLTDSHKYRKADAKADAKADPTAGADAKADVKSDGKYETPWVLSPAVRNKIDAYVECILKPRGSSFSISLPFRRTGHIKSADFFIIYSSLIDFMLTAADDLPNCYKVFFHLYSVDLIDYQSPIQTEEEIEDLFNRMIELVSLSEGIFPLSEASYMKHTLPCSIPRLLQYGTIRNIWSFGGERALPSVKVFKKRGGRSYDYTIMKKYMNHESTITQKSYNFDLTTIHSYDKLDFTQQKLQRLLNHPSHVYVEDGHMVYNDQNIWLDYNDGKDSDCNFTTFEFERLFNAIILEIRKQTTSVEDALNKSYIFRLYMAATKAVQGKRETVVEYLRAAVECPGKTKMLLSYTACKIVAKDIELLPELLAIQCETCMSATVYGIKFFGRGGDCAEDTAPIADWQSYGSQTAVYRPCNELNDIRQLWMNKKHYSSWFKCRARKASQAKVHGNIVESETKYGQLNCFFRIKLPHDPVIDGTAFASVVIRPCRSRNYINYVECSNNMYDHKVLFVPLTDFYSTVVMTVPFDEFQKPFHLSCKDKELLRYFSDEAADKISTLVLLELHPHRYRISYNISSTQQYKNNN